MKREDFLLELHTEELPPKSLKNLSQMLAQNITSQLKEQKFEYSDMEVFATPRRLALILKGLTEKQPSGELERMGPLWDKVFDENHQPTKAAMGFAQSCGVDVSLLQKLETKKGAVVYCKIHQEGKSIFDVLPDIVNQAIKQLPIVKPMRWGDRKTYFIRPVHSVIMLYGRELIPGEILDIPAGRITQGHRFLCHDILEVSEPKEYESLLKNKGHVISSLEHRRNDISLQIDKVIKRTDGEAVIDPNLLDEVTALVEWPVALLCEFPKRFLELPKEVLMASMQEHQRCFPIVNKKKQLLPYFIVISNLQSLDEQQVIRGNERVMIGRLSDAEFFYQADCMRPLSSYLDALKNVVFQAKLGSLFDKTERIKTLAVYIQTHFDADTYFVERAASLCKCDLMTSLVGEFPELQGVMGHYYAKHDKEADEVAQAIEEHYQPKNVQSDLPKTFTGKVIALADRIDTLIGIFGINKAPTGEKDPFALRRAALGVVRLIIDLNYEPLLELLEKSQDGYGDLLENENVTIDVMQFIFERFKYGLLSQEYSSNQFFAVLAKEIVSLPDFMKRIDAVKEFMKEEAAESLVQANKRVKNILDKQEKEIDVEQFDHALLIEPEEKTLEGEISTFEKKTFSTYSEQLHALSKLHQPIDRFFEKVLVMSDDASIKNNRLILLKRLRHLFLQVADISLLI